MLDWHQLKYSYIVNKSVAICAILGYKNDFVHRLQAEIRHLQQKNRLPTL